MDFLPLLTLATHLDQHLLPLIEAYGALIYLILFLLVFAETGLIITPILPGDSLLFIAGSLCATGAMNIWVLTLLITLAAFSGNSFNYYMGALAGRHIHGRHGRWLHAEILQKTHAFFDRYGGKALLLARFTPVLRTFAPFVAGMSSMPFGRFQLVNLAGALIWGAGMTLFGYAFAHAPVIQENMHVFLLIGILGTLAPIALGVIWKIMRIARKKRHEQINP
jgi:membrane-associated protein